MKSSVNVSYSFPVFTLVALVLAVGKLIDYPAVADLSWWWVVAIFCGHVILGVGVVLAILAFGFIGALLVDYKLKPILVFGIVLAITILLFLTGCSPQDPHQPSSAAGITGSEVFRTVCLNGVEYYDYDGYRRHAMAPVVDPDTLSFVRCTSL